MSDAMRGNYFVNDKETGRTANVEAVISPDGKHAVVQRMLTPEPLRGQGVQRGLLSQVCAEADAEGVTLHAYLVPETGTDVVRLAAFFEEFGFAGSDGNLLAPLVRKPKV